MKLMLFFYLSDILPNVGVIFCIIGLVGLMVGAVLLVTGLIEGQSIKTQVKATLISLCFLVLSALIPAQATIYKIAAAYYLTKPEVICLIEKSAAIIWGKVEKND